MAKLIITTTHGREERSIRSLIASAIGETYGEHTGELEQLKADVKDLSEMMAFIFDRSAEHGLITADELVRLCSIAPWGLPTVYTIEKDNPSGGQDV